MPAPTSLARRLELCLEATGRTKAELARACKVKPSSVSEWFSGESKSLRGTSALRAAEFFGVNALWLALGEGPQRPPESPQRPSTLNVHPHAREPSSDWPFRNISPARWFALPVQDRLRIETFAEATLQTLEARQTTHSNGTTG